MRDEEPMTWRDFQAMFGAVMLAVMRPMNDEQRLKMRDEIATQSKAAEDQGDARSAAVLDSLADIVELGRRYLAGH